MISKWRFVSMWVLSAVIILGIGMCNVVKAADFSKCITVEMPKWTVDNYVSAQVIITNNCNKEMSYGELSIIVYNKGKIVGSCSRPITKLSAGGFISKRFWFETATEIDKFRWSMNKAD